MAVGGRQQWVSWMAVDGGGWKTTLFVVDHTQIEHQQTPTFTLGMGT